MNWFILKEMKDKNITGLSIALVEDQKIIWQQGFGFADLKNKIKAAPDTVYRAGSISKLFNGMAVMKLVETGRMELDRPLATYLPQFRIKSRFGNTDGITPRTILTHHSGLPRDWIDGMWAKQPKPFTQLVHEIKNEYVAYPPNTMLSYSNLGVTLLGHAVQNVSGIAYAQYLDQTLIEPMGMEHSRFETGISGSRAAKSYLGGKEVFEYPLGYIPAGGLNTTATDLARLAMLVNNHGKLENRQILLPESLEAMLTVQNARIPLDLGNSIGLAWFINDKVLAQKEPVYAHGGGVIAHRAMFMVAPESKLGVVVLANTGSANPRKIAGKLLQMAWEAKNGEKLPKLKPSVAKSSDFKGTYATLIGKVSVTETSSHHYKVKSSMGKFKLNPGENNHYHLSYRLFGFIPMDLEELGEAGLSTEDISGHHIIVAELDHNRFLAGVKVTPHPIHEAWKKRLGKYKLLNPPEPPIYQIKDFELKIEDGYLVEAMALSGGDILTQILFPVNAQEVIGQGLGVSLGETVRIIKDDKGEEILTYSGLRFKRVD